MIKSKINKYLIGDTKLVVVTKNRNEREIMDIYNEGIFNFGENKVQELLLKYENLPKNINWHFIGHLQKNKVKYISEFIYMIHSVDSMDLLKEINKQAIKNNRVINFLFQIKIAKEENKYGMNRDIFFNILNEKIYKEYKNVNLLGLMGIATLTDNKNQIKDEFSELKNIFEISKNIDNNIKILSMGMSSDYKEAIETGSTMIRLGSIIFEN